MENGSSLTSPNCRKSPTKILKKLTKANLARPNVDGMVLKIEEDFDDKTICKTIATQTILTSETTTKKGSTSTIWTSEESILRSADTVDEDNKSTSSSACDEAVASSGKSGGESMKN